MTLSEIMALITLDDSTLGCEPLGVQAYDENDSQIQSSVIGLDSDTGDLTAHMGTLNSTYNIEAGLTVNNFTFSLEAIRAAPA